MRQNLANDFRKYVSVLVSHNRAQAGVFFIASTYRRSRTSLKAYKQDKQYLLLPYWWPEQTTAAAPTAPNTASKASFCPGRELEMSLPNFPGAPAGSHLFGVQ